MKRSQSLIPPLGSENETSPDTTGSGKLKVNASGAPVTMFAGSAIRVPVMGLVIPSVLWVMVPWPFSSKFTMKGSIPQAVQAPGKVI